ncbi:hypothetical protein AAGG74_19020 [Bacillus mexicanus]|uniref:hypothetical protein n=1 Tax=Bacillus mexicanus TaxID=2834415 RepID=UPI003D22DC94
MINTKKINLYSSFPVMNYGNYFSDKALKPLIYKTGLDEDTLLPLKDGISKNFLLKAEHELSLKNEIHIYGWFLTNNQHSLIYKLAQKYNAEISFYYLDKSMEELFDSYKENGGSFHYSDFLNLYTNAFDFPTEGVSKIYLERL